MGMVPPGSGMGGKPVNIAVIRIVLKIPKQVKSLTVQAINKVCEIKKQLLLKKNAVWPVEDSSWLNNSFTVTCWWGRGSTYYMPCNQLRYHSIPLLAQ